MTKEVKKTKRKPTGAAAMGAGPGRPKGIPNKNSGLIKDMITQALSDAGGVDYLVQRAQDPKTASAFLTLVGKVLTIQVTGENGDPIQTVTKIVLMPMAVDDE